MMALNMLFDNIRFILNLSVKLTGVSDVDQMSKVFLLWLTTFCTASCLVTGQTSAPKFSNEFLSIGVGARALGMSNAQVSQVADATAGYWNPAGLLDQPAKYDFSLMHAEYFAGIAKYDYIGFSTPIDSLNHIGVSVIRFGVDDIPDTRFLYDANGAINYDNIRFFSASDYAFLFSYARRVKGIKGLKLGANFKLIHRIAGPFARAWGYGLDAGAQLNLKQWRFGLMVRDLTGTFNAWSHSSELLADVYTQTGNIIPENSVEITLPKAIFGISRLFYLGKRLGLLAAADFDMTFDGKRNVPIKSDFVSIDPHMGLELNYREIIYLRGGVGNIQEIKDFSGGTSTSFQPNFGVGMRIKMVVLDYALPDIGDQSASLYSHVFSLHVSLPDKEE